MDLITFLSHLLDLTYSIASKAILVLELLMLLSALGISNVKTIRHMVLLYKLQSFILIVITILTAVTPGTSHIWVFSFTIIPLTLLLTVEPLLAHATVPGDGARREEIWQILTFKNWRMYRIGSMPIWLNDRPARRSGVLSILLNFALIGGSFGFALKLQSDKHLPDLNSLAVSLSLLLLGLAIMTNKQDIISQVMGLLVTEHGMFLASIRMIMSSQVGTINAYILAVFVIGLFAYIIITLLLLTYLLPELHRVSEHIEVENQEKLKG